MQLYLLKDMKNWDKAIQSTEKRLFLVVNGVAIMSLKSVKTRPKIKHAFSEGTYSQWI